MRFALRLFLFCSLLTLVACTQQEKETQTPDKQAVSASGYDAVLAKKLGADEYGMRKYVMAFLRKGPNREQDKDKAAKLQAAHMENIQRLADEGKLSLAGPFLDDGDLRGIYIFNVTDIEEAKALTETDPAIQSGQLVMELHPWYGSAAVMQINEVHEKISNAK